MQSGASHEPPGMSASQPNMGFRWGYPLVAVAFFIYFWGFVWRAVDTRLLYHGDMVVLNTEWWISFPWFHTGWDFFADHIREPGGFARYLGSWLAQYFHDAAAGALVFAALAAAIFVGTLVLGRGLRLRGVEITAFLSPLVVLGIASAYAFPLSDLASVAMALLAVSIYGGFLARGCWVSVRAVLFTGVCGLLFWAAGVTCLLFAVACALWEWRRAGRRSWALFYLLIAAVVVLGGMYLALHRRSDLGAHFTWSRLLSESLRGAIPSGVYLVQIAAMFLWSWLSDWRSRRAGQQAPSRDTARDQWFRGVSATALLAGIAVLASFGILDMEAQPLLRANYLARTGQWSEMLDVIAQHPPLAFPPYLLYDINRALYETNQLTDRMFAFPQDPAFLIGYGKTAVPYRGCHELLLALGCVNEAEQTAYEALEVRGPLPYILRELIVINVVKNRPEAARVFLNLLCRDVIHRNWAQDYLRRLDDNPRLDSDDEVVRLRRNMLQQDRIGIASRELFDLLLDRNPRNRMAFEYRMAHWLLTCQMDKLAEHVPAMREQGFERIPQNCAEALLLNWRITGQEPNLDGWRIDPRTYQRFEAFVQMTSGRTRDAAALAEITSGTYYPYYFAHNPRSS